MEKICPLRISADLVHGNRLQEYEHHVKCLEEDCAWFTYGCCSIVRIGEVLWKRLALEVKHEI